MDPVIHAEMTLLLKDEREFTEERVSLVKDLPIWKKRVELAENKSMFDLAEEAGARIETMRLRISEIDIELEMIEEKKKALRYESRRPSGDELRRSTALLNAMKEGGVVDPDEVALDMEFEKLANAKPAVPTDISLDFES